MARNLPSQSRSTRVLSMEYPVSGWSLSRVAELARLLRRVRTRIRLRRIRSLRRTVNYRRLRKGVWRQRKRNGIFERDRLIKSTGFVQDGFHAVFVYGPRYTAMRSGLCEVSPTRF